MGEIGAIRNPGEQPEAVAVREELHRAKDRLSDDEHEDGAALLFDIACAVDEYGITAAVRAIRLTPAVARLRERAEVALDHAALSMTKLAGGWLVLRLPTKGEGNTDVDFATHDLPRLWKVS